MDVLSFLVFSSRCCRNHKTKLCGGPLGRHKNPTAKPSSGTGALVFCVHADCSVHGHLNKGILTAVLPAHTQYPPLP